jgi:hypothetical protein
MLDAGLKGTAIQAVPGGEDAARRPFAAIATHAVSISETLRGGQARERYWSVI